VKCLEVGDMTVTQLRNLFNDISFKVFWNLKSKIWSVFMENGQRS